MSDLLSAVQSVHHHQRADGDEDGLRAVSSTSTRSKPVPNDPPPLANKDSKIGGSDEHGAARPTASSPAEALQILRQEPDLTSLLGILNQLRQNTFASGPFSLHIPGPIQAQIINTLVVHTIPDFWAVLTRSQQVELTACLLNVAGLNAATARLKQLISERKFRDGSDSELILTLVEVVKRLFTGDEVLSALWKGITTHVVDSTRCDMIWKESVNLVASGKVISTIAQAEDVSQTKSRCWLSNGNDYAAWLGRNVANLAATNSRSKGTAAAAQVLNRFLSLGHPNMLLNGLFGTIMVHDTAPAVIEQLLFHLPAHVKRPLTEHTLRWLSTFDLDSDNSKQSSGSVAAIGAFLSIWYQDDSIKRHVISFLTNPALLVSTSLAVIRACITALSTVDDTDDLYRTLEKQMSTFSDRLFVDHAPVVQQENLTRALLIFSGYVHRQKPVGFLVLARSSISMQGVSNRLDSSNVRARWLGMLVATAISRLADKEGSKLSFESDELETEDAASYMNLTTIEDRIGTIDDFSKLLTILDRAKHPKKPAKSLPQRQRRTEINGKPVFGPPRPPTQTEIVGERVTEILDDDSDEQDDLTPYAKPDSDPEDSDEDATMVNRKKVRPPVYIRDLMAMLRDNQSHDRFQMGMKHAASLIRRKANFGAEVKDHAEELARILCNLQDPFETENFDELKLQSLIAVLLVDVKSLAPWLSRQAFSGDYSIAQRCIILSALGLGGRELAGLANEDDLNPALPLTSFPSKRLPPHLHAIYGTNASSTKRLDAASTSMERALIQPIALQAADKTTAHLNAVKVRTFSSRMEVERTKRKPAPNQLAKVFGESFFFPLANGYQQEIAAYSTSSVFASTPFVLVTYLKTVALLLHASGPATVDLLGVGAEYWDLLLSLRVQAVSDISVLQAVLFSLLTLLEVFHDKRQIATDFPRQLMETQQWVDLVFERTGGGHLISEKPNDDEAKVRTLAAGVLVKTKGIIDAYQKQLVGYMP